MPKADEAKVSAKKVESYLLDTNHPVGRFKARVFRALGYNDSSENLLANQLTEIGMTQDIVSSVASSFGQKYVVDGILNTPSGRGAKIRTVWILEEDGTPRFLTAYPG